MDYESGKRTTGSVRDKIVSLKEEEEVSKSKEEERALASNLR